MTLGGDDPRAETMAITIHDQDKNLPLLTRITLDVTADQDGFLASEAVRNVVRQAADDWSYFLDDMKLDTVPAMDERTFIWDPTGFISGHVVQNATAYLGFLEYADVLALEPVGYKLRTLAFERWVDAIPDCP